MNRRGFLLGAAGLLAAPAIVRVGLIMPVKRVLLPEAWGKVILSGIDDFGEAVQRVRTIFQDDLVRGREGSYHLEIPAEDMRGFGSQTPVMVKSYIHPPGHGVSMVHAEVAPHPNWNIWHNPVRHR